jgi:hypothetical protein
MRQTWIYFCYRFLVSVVNSLTLSTPYVSCLSYYSGDFRVYSDFVLGDDFWSVVTQFSLTIPCVNDDPVFSFDFVRQPWINMRCRFHPSGVNQFQSWFLVLQRLSFRCRFLYQHWHNVFDDSMRQTWIYFCYRFLALVVNSLTLSTPYCQLPLIFQWRFHGLKWRCFRWRFLVSSNAVFTNDSMRQRWLSFVFWFLSSNVN